MDDKKASALLNRGAQNNQTLTMHPASTPINNTSSMSFVLKKILLRARIWSEREVGGAGTRRRRS